MVLGGGTLKAQSYVLQVVPTLGSGSTVLLDVQIRRTGAAYALGPSSIIIDIPANMQGCIQAANATIVGGSIGSFIANYTQSNPNPAQRWYNGSGVVVNGNTSQITLSTLATGLSDANAAGVLGVIVPNSFTTLVRISVPLLSCGGGPNCTDPTLGGFTLDPISVVTQYDFSGGLPFYTPLSGGSLNVNAPAGFSITPPTVTSPSSPQNIFVCTVGQTLALNFSANSYVSVVSSIGSNFSGPTFLSNVGSATLRFNQIPVTPVVDTIYVRNRSVTAPTDPGASNNCVTAFIVNVLPPPSLGFSLSAVGGSNVCTSGPTGTANIRLSGSQSGVTYELINDGVPTGITVLGNGNAVTFPPVTGLIPKSLPGYNFTYRVNTPCLVTPNTNTPGLNINVVNCTVPISISTVTPASPQCGNSTVNFGATVTGVPFGVTPSFLWTAANGSGPVITFPGGNAAQNVVGQLGIKPTTQTDVVTVQVQYADPAVPGVLFTGSASVNYTVFAAANPIITGPNFLYLPGASVTGSFNSPNTPGSNYTWSITAGPSGSSIASPAAPSTNITFNASGTYTLLLQETTSNGCIGSKTLNVLVSDCNSNPGVAGPDQNICFGNSTAVFVDNTVSASDGLQWQTSPNGVSWTNASGIGANGQVYITSNALPVGITYFRLVARGQPPVLPNSFCENYSRTIAVNVQNPSAPGSITDNNGSVTPSVCRNSSVDLILGGGSGNITWQQSATGFSWTTAIGTGINTNNFTSGLLSSNTYFRAKRANGCDSTFSNVIYVQVGNTPVSTITTPSLPAICAGATSAVIQSTVSPTGATGLWTTTNGSGTFTAPTFSLGLFSSNYISVPADAGKTINLQWVVTSGNCPPNISSISIVVTSNASASITSPPPSATICAGGMTPTLNGLATNGVGSWSAIDNFTLAPAGGNFFPNANSANVTYQASTTLGPRTVRLVWTVSNGVCPPVSASQTVNVNNNLVNGTWVLATPSGNPPDICYSNTITSAPLGASVIAPTIGSWNTGSVSGQFLNPFTLVPDPSNPNAVYKPSPTDQGTAVQLVWSIFNPSAAACGVVQFTKSLTVGTSPTGSIAGPDTLRVCWNGIARLQATVSGGTNTQGTWKLYPFGPIPPTAGALAASITPPSLTLASPGSSNLISIYTPTANDSNRAFLLYWVVSSGSGLTACPSDSFYKVLLVSGDAVGQIQNSSPLLQICAGTSTAPLQAILGDRNPPVQVRLPFAQQYFAGRWTTSNGNGLFANATSPNTTYLAALSDAGNTVNLTWRVNSAGCGSRDYTVQVPVSSSSVTGAFGTGPNQGLGIPLGSVCVGTTTAPLGGTVGGTAVGTWSTTNGAGQFINPLTGLPTTNFGGAVYRPAPADSNRTIDIVWTITDIIGGCNPAVITRPLDVRPVLRGQFGPVPIICYPSPSAILNLRNLGDSRATPSYFAQGGAGTFVPGNTLRNVRYFPDTTDIGKTITLMLILNNGACTPDTQRRQVFVAGQSQLSITSNVANLCAGDAATLTSAVSGGVTAQYSWSGPPGANITTPNTLASIGIAPVIPGSVPVQVPYTLTATIFNPVPGGSGQCAFQQTFNQNVIPGTVITAATGLSISTAAPSPLPSTPITYCQEQNFVATMLGTNDNGTSYRWRAVPAAGVVFSDPNIKSPTVVIRTVTSNTALIAEARTFPNGCISTSTAYVATNSNTPPRVNTLNPSTQNIIACQDNSNNGTATIPLRITNNPSCGVSMWFNVPPGSLPSRSFSDVDTTAADLRGIYIPGSFNNGSANFPTVRFPINNITTGTVWTFYCGGSCELRQAVTVVVNPNPDPTFVLYAIDPDTSVAKRAQTRALTSRRYVASIAASSVNQTLLNLPNFAQTVGFEDSTRGTITQRQWDFGDPASGIANNTDVAAVTQHAYTRPGVYTVVLFVTNNQNCSRFASAANVLRIREPEFFFPTAFSPNGDRINDVFRALPLEANPKVTSLRIFNKEGELVFEALGDEAPTGALDPGTFRNPGWNGKTLAGGDFAPGVYTYRAVVEISTGVTKTYSGNVTLIR